MELLLCGALKLQIKAYKCEHMERLFTILSSGSLPSQRSLLPSGIETSYDFSKLQPLRSYVVNSPCHVG